MKSSVRGWRFLAGAGVAAALLWGVACPAIAQDEDAALSHAKRLLKKAILFDGHNDLPWAIRGHKPAPGDLVAYDLRGKVPGQTDLARLREGRLGAQFWSVYVPGEMAGAARMQLEQIDLTRRLIDRYPDAFRLAGTAADVRAAHRAGRIGSMLGIEGGHAIENSLGALRAYYDLGVRYMTLTHNTHTAWADAAAQVPARSHGLSAFGEEVVREMNRLGMLVDLSHTSPETMDDALRVSRAPVIFSHSAARALCDVPRNVPDEILRRLSANGGVLMVTFVSGFIDPAVDKVTGPAMREYNLRAREAKSDAELDQLFQDVFGKLEIPPTSIAKVADHIDHIRKVAGVRHVGIGGDYDGNTLWPTGLEDVSGYPKLFAELIRRGWNDEDLKLLAGENVLRALEKAERVAAELKKTTPASVMQLRE
jgi:membrane dipeptidase